MSPCSLLAYLSGFCQLSGSSRTGALVSASTNPTENTAKAKGYGLNKSLTLIDDIQLISIGKVEG